MNEFRHYLELLLAHRCRSAPESCKECLSLQRIYDFMRTEIFSTVVYAESPRETATSAAAH
jgi:proteasome lid subunit RPN8/RPN11